MPDIINIIEPTLTTEAGHCYSFISTFCNASKESSILKLWVSRSATLTFAQNNIQINNYFFRKIRRLQCFFLYRKLLVQPEKLFITTAGHPDLLLINWASKNKVPPNKVYLYFHWFNTNKNKLAALRNIALKQPNLTILGPTVSVIKIFQDAGFKNAHIAPYPISKREASLQPPSNKFEHLLYAGAARSDKGFSQVVDLVAHMKEHNLSIPIVLQTSAEHYGKYDSVTLSDINRLQTLAYSQLRNYQDTLNANEYSDLFKNAICLQLYDASSFFDRISGVTLDAFSLGCPIIATAGTWIARMVFRFEAGVVIDDTSPTTVLTAVQQVIANFQSYARNAIAAGRVLQEENSADELINAMNL